MTPDTPETQEPDGQDASRTDGSDPRPPRVLVSVGDFEDPAEWDVIVVENDAIDDDTARRMARKGQLRPQTVSLPSLDESDVLKHFETDKDAEDIEAASVEAFGPPEDATPVRRRAAAPLPPVTEAFAGHPEPGDEPVAEEPAVEGPGPEFAFEQPAADADDADTTDAEDADDPRTDDDAVDWDPEATSTIPPAPFLEDEPAEAEPEPDPEEAEEERDLLDDPSAEFYAIGDGEQLAADAGPPAVPVGLSVAEEGEAERDLLDDPSIGFYDLGPDADDADERARLSPAPAPADAERVGASLWGSDPDAPPPIGDDEPVVAPVAPVADLANPFEDEVEFDSSFPLGPDDLTVEGEVEPVELDSLDYASVFGPVRGGVAAPALEEQPQPRRRPRPTYEDDSYSYEAEEPEPDDRWAVAPARTRGRRRELVALGIAAGVMIAIGIGSQIYGGTDRPDQASTLDSTTTRVRERTDDTSTTVGVLTIPTLPADTAPDLAEGAGTDGDDTTATTRRRTTTTTKRPADTTPTTAPPATTTPTTAPPATTTPTTAPPDTTPDTTTPGTTPPPATSAPDA